MIKFIVARLFTQQIDVSGMPGGRYAKSGWPYAVRHYPQEISVVRGIEMSNGYRSGRTLSLGRRREAGLYASNSRPLSALDFVYLGEAETIGMYDRTNRRSMLSIKSLKRRQVDHYFSARYSMLGTGYRGEARPAGVGIRGPGSRGIYCS